MGSRKRSRETDMAIKVASGDPIEADSLLVRTSCDNARGLPAPADVWDVSGLLLDGQPFARDTVSCWLNCACSAVHGMAELNEQDVQQLSTVAGLAQVLAFADAVGSYKGLCNAACSQLKQLKFVVQLPVQVLELPVAGNVYQVRKPQQVMQVNLQEKSDIGAPLATVKQWEDVQQQVGKQLSALLKVAHVLRLQLLLNTLHEFVFCSACTSTSLFEGRLGLVFTDAVLEAAMGSSALSKEAYVSSVLSRPCSLTPGDSSSLLKPLSKPVLTEQSKMLTFDAQLQREFAGGSVGDTVKVGIDFFEFGRVVIANHEDLTSRATAKRKVVLPAQLLLGKSFQDEAALVKFLHPGDSSNDGDNE